MEHITILPRPEPQMMPIAGVMLILERMKSAVGCREAREKGSGDPACLKVDPDMSNDENISV